MYVFARYYVFCISDVQAYAGASVPAFSERLGLGFRECTAIIAAQDSI